MNKLILATSMVGLALVVTQAQAGSPNYKVYRDQGFGSTPHTTRCDCSNCSASTAKVEVDAAT